MPGPPAAPPPPPPIVVGGGGGTKKMGESSSLKKDPSRRSGGGRTAADLGPELATELTVDLAELPTRNGRGRIGGGGVDPELWQACAGPQARLPQVGTHIIYFPQGHAEACRGPGTVRPGPGPFPDGTATISARVLSVTHLADPETDEVYARIALKPENCPPPISYNHNPDISDSFSSSSSSTHSSSCSSPAAAPGPIPDPRTSPSISYSSSSCASSFAKTLTQSDANNGGGFSVPRYCAETIFPRLDYSEDPPIQIVLATDIHGTVWKFRHIYRGTPRRHLLTTGWSNFVNRKRLVAGDAIVFLRSGPGTGDLRIGVRRSSKKITSTHAHHRHQQPLGTPPVRWDHIDKPYPDHFHARRPPGTPPQGATGLVPAPGHPLSAADSVGHAIALASSGQTFEITYYPRASIYEFCVPAHRVRASLQHNWCPGLRFKMAVETEDASRVSWFMGTVSNVQDADPLMWPNSPWKILKVIWDEPDLLQGISRVSPWQVELVPPLQLPPFSFPKKKVRLSQPSELRVDMPPRHITSSLDGYVDNVIPAGMQGARHERNYNGFSILRSPKFHPTLSVFLNTSYDQHFVAGHLSSTRNSIMPAQGGSNVIIQDFFEPSLLPNNVEVVNNLKDGPHSLAKDSGDGFPNRTSRSFVLFGKTIDTSPSVSFPIKSSEVSGGGNSFDSLKYEAYSDGNKSEVYDNMHIFFPSHQEIENLNNCKVFSDSDDIGQFINLSTFDTYGELYKRLETMLGAKDGELNNRIIYVDFMGISRPIGGEPYRDFVRKVKRLNVLEEYKRV